MCRFPRRAFLEYMSWHPSWRCGTLSSWWEETGLQFRQTLGGRNWAAPTDTTLSLIGFMLAKSKAGCHCLECMTIRRELGQCSKKEKCLLMTLSVLYEKFYLQVSRSRKCSYAGGCRGASFSNLLTQRTFKILISKKAFLSKHTSDSQLLPYIFCILYHFIFATTLQ